MSTVHFTTWLVHGHAEQLRARMLRGGCAAGARQARGERVAIAWRARGERVASMWRVRGLQVRTQHHRFEVKLILMNLTSRLIG